MKNFILERDGEDYLFIEEQNQGLTLASQNRIFHHVFEFIKSEYTVQAKTESIIEVCKAAIELFHSLKIEESAIGGIVSIVNCNPFIIIVNMYFVSQGFVL